MDDQAEAYCRARLAGLNDEDAAKKAGYSSRPSPLARQMWHVAQLVADLDPYERDEHEKLYKEELERLARREAAAQASLRKTRNELIRLKRTMRAARLFEGRS